MKLMRSLFACIFFMPLAYGTLSAGSSRKGRPNIDYDKQLIIVSTVDGKLSALDLKRSGQVLWTIDINDGPLISSSITNLVYEEEGKTVRLIPSLHGGLFKFDGDTVEAVPFNADTLLKSSFRLAENTVLVGGKETHFTGLDIETGNVLYSCSVKGCDKQQTVPDTSDVVVVKRFQQTVRSIQNRNGAENWNFSVGEIELQFVKGSGSRLLQNNGVKTTSNPEEFQFEQVENIKDSFDFSDLSRIKFVVPDGTVCVVNPSHKQTVMWKYKCSAAISSAWVVLNNQLQKLDMFDASKVPALGKDAGTASSSDVIYMGTYDKQVYVQESPSVQQAISQAVVNNNVHNPGHAAFTPPRFTHKPCHSKLKFLTISDSQSVSKSGKQTALVASNTGKLAAKPSQHIMFCPDSTNEKGYYFQGDLSFYARIQQSGRKGRNTIIAENNGSQPESSQGYLGILSYFDKYVIFTLITLIIIPFLIFYLPSWIDRKYLHSDSNSSGQYDTATAENVPAFSPAREYESRFLQDFEPQECLGKGGFGVVFKAKNKMDGCSYAVKRILLPNSSSAREKVLREVRALAQLDHPSIVRYFNAWSEQPPVGWQKKQDDKLDNDLSIWSSMPQQSELNKHSASTSANSSQAEVAKQSDSYSDEFEVITDETKNFFDPAYSQGFSFHAEKTSDSQQHFREQFSGSWADNSLNERNLPETLKGKFFQNDSSDSGSTSGSDWKANNDKSLPFQHYQNPDNSCSIVFDEQSEQGNDSHHYSMKESSSPKFHSHSFLKSSKTENGSLYNASVDLKKNDPDKTAEDNQQSHCTVYLYIQMQLCKKESLKEWLVANVHREKTVYTRIFSQVLEAVKYVHDRGLIHRDLKPSNVLFSLDNTIKVGDFGLVTHAGEISTAQLPFFDEAAQQQHTKQAGTTLYMAPEQMSSCLYTNKVDIFALGLILFELVYSFATQMEKVSHFSDARQHKFPKNFRSKFPQEAALVLAMLRKDAGSRPSADDIINDEMFG